MSQKFRPILMSPLMVRATREQQKTETRRLTGLDQINEEPGRWKFKDFEPPDKLGRLVAVFEDATGLPFQVRVPCPYGAPGDLLWVRENWAVGKGYDGLKTRAVCELLAQVQEYVFRWFESDGFDKEKTGKIRPSIHMPRIISRYYLELKSVRVERLQDIDEIGAMAEGVQMSGGLYVQGFHYIWFTINGEGSWDFNPWVWVLKYFLLAPVQ